MILETKAADSRTQHRDFLKKLSSEAKCHQSLVSTAEREAVLKQRAATIWLTGLAGAGKTTIAYALERKLFDEGHLATVLDGRNLRLGLNVDLAYSDQERSENLRRAAEVAKISNDSGLITICAFLSPHRSDRDSVRELIGSHHFIEVYLDTPTEVCRRRREEYPDPKSLKPFGDADAPFEGYETPDAPEILLNTGDLTIDDCVQHIFDYLVASGYFVPRGGS